MRSLAVQVTDLLEQYIGRCLIGNGNLSHSSLPDIFEFVAPRTVVESKQ